MDVWTSCQNPCALICSWYISVFFSENFRIGASGISTIRIDQPVMDDLSARQNVYNMEGMKVDCVVITKNSKYVVTGSGMGPPQVWDTQVI